MTAGRRLLTIYVLIFVAAIFVAPRGFLGQDGVADRIAAIKPTAAPIATPKLPPPLRWAGPNPPWSFPRPGPVVHDGGVLQNLVRSAGIIFSGKVTAIAHDGSSAHDASSPERASGPNAASTSITFQVERAVRGASPGHTLTIHEWAGLWGHGERYYVGERVLLFLYAPSKLGFTSPVAGMLGKFAMDSRDGVVMNELQKISLSKDPMLGSRTVVPYYEFILSLRRFGVERIHQ